MIKHACMFLKISIYFLLRLYIQKLHFFFLNDPPTPETYPLPLHDALPISRHVVSPATLAHFKGSRRRNAPVARVEPHHHLAQTDQVPVAFFSRLDGQPHALTSTALCEFPNWRSIDCPGWC